MELESERMGRVNLEDSEYLRLVAKTTALNEELLEILVSQFRWMLGYCESHGILIPERDKLVRAVSSAEALLDRIPSLPDASPTGIYEPRANRWTHEPDDEQSPHCRERYIP
ncbi:MAG: hypothetical protein JRN39_00345 [Nitrososphaerota archaeon]|nr:hypothetical protein [Nitrososphaerota archaeon]MDG6938845.1 hypothetical protein [Nitrososphaerota archaeon]